MISVVVADDQTLVRKGIRSLLGLAADVRVAAEAADGDEALAAVARVQPDVLLLDLKMPRRDGLGVLRELRARHDTTPALILTTFDDTNLVLEGIRTGARGYLLKDVSLEQLLTAIRALAGGDTMFQPAITERILRGIEHLPSPPADLERPSPLTTREREILRLMAGGLSNREIAHALDLADGTVKNHVSNVLAKLGVRDRTRAVLRGLELGCI